MNKIIFFIFSCLIFGLSGCEQKIDTWSGKDVAYVDMEADSTLVSFIYINTDVDTVQVRVQVMGNIPEDQPRYVDVKVKAENATVGTDYEAIENRYTIEGGNIFCTIPVVLKRPADQTIKAVEIELMENEYFSLPMDIWRPLELKDYTRENQNVIRHVVGLTDEVFEPKAWTTNYFGPYSKKKMKLLCEMFGLQMADFDNVTEMDMERQRVYAQGLDKYLKEMDAKGETVYEDRVDKDGNPVKMAVGPLV